MKKHTMVIVGSYAEIFPYNNLPDTITTNIEFEKGGVVEKLSNESYTVGKHFNIPAIPIIGFKGEAKIIDISDFSGTTHSNFQEYVNKK